MSRSNREERSGHRYTSAVDRAHKAEQGSGSSYVKLPEGHEWFKPKVGTFSLDILPFEAGKGNPFAEAGALHWERTIYIHRSIGPNGDFVLCPAKNSNKPCPVCEHRAKLMRQDDKDESTEQLIQDLGPKQRQLFNIRNRKEPEKKYVWDISYHLFGKVLDARLRNSDEEDDYGRFFFIEDGLTLKVGFGEKSFAGNTFCETESIDFKARASQYDDEILEDVVKFDDCLIEMPYDKLKALFLQTAGSDEDEEEEVAPKKKKVVDEDEDDDTPKRRKPPVDEDEEEEAPKKKSKPVEDEDDDEPPKKKKVVEEEEEDELPPKKKKVVDEDEEEEKPHIKARPLKEEDDEDVPKKKKRVEEDEEDEPKKKKPAKDDDDDGWDDFDDDAPKKKKPVVDEDEEPPKKKKKPTDEEDDD